jgi:SHS2 domain-containing protein
LLAISAIVGLGYLGQSIRENMETLTGEMSGEAAERRRVELERELGELHEQVRLAAFNVLEAEAEDEYSQNPETDDIENMNKIANAAADAAAEAFQAALDAGDTQEEAARAASFAAYLAVLDTGCAEEMEAVTVGNDGKDHDNSSSAIFSAAVFLAETAKAAYISAWTACNGRAPTPTELVEDMAYAATFYGASLVLSAYREASGATYDVSVIAQELAEQAPALLSSSNEYPSSFSSPLAVRFYNVFSQFLPISVSSSSNFPTPHFYAAWFVATATSELAGVSTGFAMSSQYLSCVRAYAAKIHAQVVAS